MKRFLLPLVLSLGFAPLACDDDDDGDSGGDTGNDGGDHADHGESGSAEVTSSSMQTCESMHSCVNDVCVCETPGLEDQSCTDDDACVDECEVCM